MIREHFCNYENSLELRELGFTDNTMCAWDIISNNLIHKLSSSVGEDARSYWDKHDNSLRAPLLSQAIEWLEKNYNLILTVDWYSFNSTWRYCIEMKDTSSFNFYVTEEAGFLSWNAAAQEGITSAISYLKNSIG